MKQAIGYSRSLDFFVQACRCTYITKQKNRSDNEEALTGLLVFHLLSCQRMRWLIGTLTTA
jgi:hypothetical protein